MKIPRLRDECYLYAKLIFIVLGWQLVWTMATYLFHQENRLLSLFKAFKTLTTQLFDEMRDAFVWGTQSPQAFMFRFYRLSMNYHLLEKKKNKLPLLETLLLVANNNKTNG